MKELGLIGFGNFGKLVYSLLKEHFKIFIYDINQANIGIDFSTLEECITKDIIILAIPVQNLESLLITIKDKINKYALVADVSSVKIKPVKLMTEHLPETCEIMGTHPLFGKESMRKNPDKLKIFLSPVKLKNQEKITSFLTDKLKLKVIIKTPEEHDSEMGYVQGLTHFIGKALIELNIKDSELKTLSYDYLYRLTEIIRNDTDDLFYTIQNENSFSRKYRKKLMDKLSEINERLNKHLQ